MKFRESLPEIEKLCVDRLGEYAGPSLAAMARPAFRLDEIADGGTATGHCRPGLLNFFFLDPDLNYDEWRHLDFESPRAWRVIPADPAHARETAAPAPARSFAMTPLHATPVPTIPAQWDHAIRRPSAQLTSHR